MTFLEAMRVLALQQPFVVALLEQYLGVCSTALVQRGRLALTCRFLADANPYRLGDGRLCVNANSLTVLRLLYAHLEEDTMARESSSLDFLALRGL